MKLEQLFLKKEELPILYGSCFQIPIHSKLLDESINLDPLIAKKIFPQVAEEWYADLKEYVKIEKDQDKKEWFEEVFLKEKPKIIQRTGYQIFRGWEDNIMVQENGFVSGFSISRDGGGSLYFNKEDYNCETLVPNSYIKFTEEKTEEFKALIEGHSKYFTYSSHNIDSLPGALFLRNWAIKYMNEVFKEVF
ncbi:hypothetical protein KAI04_03385 [Candidatus Pacearchaeota archaeon]|nr:hypothetical protein [Candidatus Pacearchaeota archaeon]